MLENEHDEQRDFVRVVVVLVDVYTHTEISITCYTNIIRNCP